MDLSFNPYFFNFKYTCGSCSMKFLNKGNCWKETNQFRLQGTVYLSGQRVEEKNIGFLD